mmetsp:Transcript_54177/g.121184  ORF Transcript_54177/g.121184 Transcript_54177/m.121184 type:complete len:228 (+) Transcript_54177:827-1510(+)
MADGHDRGRERVHVGDGLPHPLFRGAPVHGLQPVGHCGVLDVHPEHHCPRCAAMRRRIHRVPDDVGGGRVLHQDPQRGGPDPVCHGPGKFGFRLPWWHGRQRHDRALHDQLPEWGPRPHGSDRHSLGGDGVRHGRLPPAELHSSGCAGWHHDRGGPPHLQVVLSGHDPVGSAAQDPAQPPEPAQEGAADRGVGRPRGDGALKADEYRHSGDRGRVHLRHLLRLGCGA